MTTLIRTLVVACFVLLGSSNSAFASVEYFELRNHPDGGARPPLYGLRTDGLDGDNSSVFTFDFNHVNSTMMLELTKTAGNPTKIRIYGDAYGGKDIGSGYSIATAGIYSVDFTYNSNITSITNGVKVTDHDWTNHLGSGIGNHGTITGPAGVNLRSDTGGDPDTVQLVDQSNGSYAFKFIDGTHRGYTGLNGWGWLSYDDIPGNDNSLSGHGVSHTYATDWLFTAFPTDVPQGGSVTPEPASAITWILLSSIGFGTLRVRKRHLV